MLFRSIYFEREQIKFDKIIVAILLIGCLLLTTFKCTYSYIDKDKNSDLRIVTTVLVEEGYTFGYASYWNANIITELSNGSVEVANVLEFDEMSFFKWSSPMKYYEADYHKDKVFVLLTNEEYEEYKDSKRLAEGTTIYQDDAYRILNYASMEDVIY